MIQLANRVLRKTDLAATQAIASTAMVFAAGLGTRMQPITQHMPKPLVRIGGKAMLDHMLDRLAEAGVEQAVVNVHWLADQIETHLADRIQPRIILSDERAQLLDQGGGIVKVLPLFENKPFIICNTDALWLEGPRSNLARLMEGWDPNRMDAYLLVAAAATSVGIDWRGDFTLDSHGRLMRRQECQVAPFVYSGVGIIKSSLFANLHAEPFKLAPFFFEAAQKGRLYGLRLEGQWLHVGDAEAIDDAERAYQRSIL